MKNKLLLLLIGVLIFIFSISGCKVLEFLFLPQDLSSEITGAYYIDNSSFKLIGKGAEWNAQSDDIPKYVDVLIPNRDKNQVFRIYRASNYGCKVYPNY